MNKQNDWRPSRREALRLMGAFALSTQLPGFAAEDAAKDTKGIALQLYTMRDAAKADLSGTLKKVREIGWEYVQWSGMPDLPADRIRAELDAAGLKAMASHTGVEAFEADFAGQVQSWKTVGVTAVGPGGMMGDCTKDLEAWLAGAKRLDALGAKLRDEGMILTYHNHAGEFETFDGDPRCKLDILFEATGPENLFFELDVAWVKAGGADPAAYMRKYGKRVPQIHAKDLADQKGTRRVRFTPLGEGCLDWEDIFAAGKEIGCAWYIYEQDTVQGDVFEAAKISFDFRAKHVL